MTVEKVAAELLQRVAPGDALLQGVIAAGEPVAAAIDLIEKAAADGVRLSGVLLDEVERLLLADGVLDEDDTRSVTEDLASLRAAAPALR